MKFIFSSVYRQAMRHAGAWSSRGFPGHTRWIHGEHSNVSLRQPQPPGSVTDTLKSLLPPGSSRPDRPPEPA